jgi:hypothetical protein
LGSLPERFMGAKTAVSPILSSCPKARKVLHCASVPEKGPLQCFPRIGPREGTLAVFPAHQSPSCHPLIDHLKIQDHSIVHQLRGAVCSPNLSGPKTSSPSTLRGRLTSARRPHSRLLPQAIIIILSVPSLILQLCLVATSGSCLLP